MTNTKKTQSTMTRRQVIKSGAAVAAGSTLGGLASPALAQGADLTWLTFNVDQRESLMEPLAQGIGRDLGINVTVDYVEVSNFIPRLQVALAGGAAPDLVTLQPTDFQAIAAANELADIGDAIAADPDWQGKLAAGNIEAGTVGDSIFGLSTSTAAMALYGNADILEAKGLSKPGSLDEFYGWTDQLGDVAPTSWGSGDNWYAEKLLYPIAGQLAGADAMIAASGGSGSWTAPEIVQAFTVLLEMKNRGMFPNGAEAIGWQDAKRLFYAQSASTWYFGSWQIGIFGADGIIKSDANPDGLTLDPFLFPAVSGDTSPVLPADYGSKVSVPFSGANRDAAIEVVRWLTTEPGQLITANAYQLPSMVGLDMSGLELEQPFLGYLDFFAANLDKTVPMSSRNSAVGTALTTAVQALMTGSMTPEEAAASVEAAAASVR